MYSTLDKHMWGVRRVTLPPLTTKTDTGSNSKNNERNSQKTRGALLRKSTKSTVVMSGDFPSPPSLSPEFNVPRNAQNLSRIYSSHSETRLTFWSLRLSGMRQRFMFTLHFFYVCVFVPLVISYDSSFLT